MREALAEAKARLNVAQADYELVGREMTAVRAQARRVQRSSLDGERRYSDYAELAD